MKKLITKPFISKTTWKILITVAFILVIYFLISLYFASHFFFNTVVNGMDFSLKSHDEAESIVKKYVNTYQLQLIERNGDIEVIRGQAIQMQYNKENCIPDILRKKNPLKWISSLVKPQEYFVNDLFLYNESYLESEINNLNCLKGNIIEPINVRFLYQNGSYKMIKEVEGNKIVKDELSKSIKTSILNGETKLNLNKKLCYQNPKYTADSKKSLETLKLLNKFVSTNVNYNFNNESVLLNGEQINEWLTVDENLDVVIDKAEVIQFIKEMSRKFDTVGITRHFKTSTGKMIQVEGGLYGWKIDREEETKALLNSIDLGETIEREPIYAQRALYRGEDEFGDTYVEVSITRQFLWFYKNGKLIAQGPIVTGNPNKGNSTVTGTYMLNYKQKGATLRGVNYAREVTYWMPFFGNMGIHDACWRHSFGGQIYKSKGTHGCINAPLYLAKVIYDNIDESIAIIIYIE